MGKTISLNVLDNVEIATPCTASWEEMTGNDQTRYCSHCSLNVYNLSAMTSEEATGFIARAEGRVCIRLYRRSDGTVLTQDCPTGLRAARERVSRSIRNIAATVVTLAAGIFGLGAREARAQGGVSARVVMGGVGKSVHVEPEEPKRGSDTVQTKRDTIAADDSRSMIMGGMAIRQANEIRPEPMKFEPVTLEPVVTRSVTVEPVVAEPIVIEQMRPRPLKGEQDGSELSFVLGDVVVNDGPAPEQEDVAGVDRTPADEPGCDSEVPVVDGIARPEIR